MTSTPMSGQRHRIILPGIKTQVSSQLFGYLQTRSIQIRSHHRTTSGLQHLHSQNTQGSTTNHGNLFSKGNICSPYALHRNRSESHRTSLRIVNLFRNRHRKIHRHCCNFSVACKSHPGNRHPHSLRKFLHSGSDVQHHTRRRISRGGFLIKFRLRPLPHRRDPLPLHLRQGRLRLIRLLHRPLQ